MTPEKNRATKCSVIPQEATIGGHKFNLLDLSRCHFEGEGWNKITHADWLAEGERRFGKNPSDWKFVCASCGHIQAIGDFRQYKDRGATPETAAQLCIGRFTGAKGAFDPAKYKPCNYTVNGLFCLAKTVVVMEKGAQQPVFEFAEAAA
jgi:hypothetical protein